MKVYCGENAALIQNNIFTIIFLRISDENVISILNHSIYGVIGVVYGFGKGFNASCEYCFADYENCKKYYSNSDYSNLLNLHQNDKFTTKNGQLTYTTYNNRQYRLYIAENMEETEFNESEPNDNLSIAEKMKIWNCGQHLYNDFSENNFEVECEANTEKYSAVFNINSMNNFVYCRFSLHGYTNKGYAMLSTICIRQNECRMIEDNRKSLDIFTPNDSYFSENSCAFPSDGSWYWSVKSICQDTIYLNGCGGSVYEIHRH